MIIFGDGNGAKASILSVTKQNTNLRASFKLLTGQRREKKPTEKKGKSSGSLH